MKRNILTALIALSLTAAGSAQAASNPAHAHDATHAQGGGATTLQLNAGKKWETDAALRKAIGDIRRSMAASLHAIHENRLTAGAYGGLARQVDGAVGEIVAHCKLEAQADAQLHLIVAELLEGAEQMAGKKKPVKRRDGALKVLGALDKYGQYFDDPGFQPIAH